MQLQPGTMVTPNVRLIERLAEGGMGSVWMADHIGLETRVAVKFISAEIAGSDATVGTRFKREAAISAQIRSVHVVQTFDHGLMEDGTPYIVMELLEGSTLAEWLRVQPRLSLRETALVVSQVGKVLHRSHVLGIVHRDIKPENIFLVDSDYEIFVKVLDFGIAKHTRSTRRQSTTLTETGVVVGTLEYMSPEQAVGARTIDGRSDLWSLAVVAYQALTGRLPFVANDGEPLWRSIAVGRLPLPSELCSDLPTALDGFFEQALARTPELRYQTAQELSDALARIAAPKGRLDGGLPEADDDDHDIGEARTLEKQWQPGELEPSSDPITARFEVPAQYDLLGPDSHEPEPGHEQSTMLMDAGDHERAGDPDRSGAMRRVLVTDPMVAPAGGARGSPTVRGMPPMADANIPTVPGWLWWIALLFASAALGATVFWLVR